MPFVRAVIALCVLARARRAEGPCRRSFLQKQAAHHPDQLRLRRADRHRGAPVRQAPRPPHRRPAQHRRPEHGGRRRHRRRQISRRGGAARRYHGGLFHRHRLHVCARPRALSRRLQDLRVRGDPGRHHGPFRAHRRCARDEGADRHRQGAEPDRRGLERRYAEGPAAAARHGHAGRAVQIRHGLSLEPVGAARIPARRDQLLLGIAAELPRHRRSHSGEDRTGDPGVLRRRLRR